MALIADNEYRKTRILCLSCAAILHGDKTAPSIICPDCGTTINLKQQFEIYRYAFYCLRYGYQYRQYYEERTDSKIKPFLAPLGEMATFIAIAAISGVIGNATYDALKKAVQKLISQESKCEAKNDRFLPTNEEFEQFFNYLTDFHNGFSSAPEFIREAIFEEMLGDAAAESPQLADRLLELLGKEQSKSKEIQVTAIYRELVRRQKARVLKKPNISPHAKMWEKVK
ncbi:MAG: hypothetical protein PHH36_00560 [Sideroxydans sp.]|nr:hypothetical protein [Sideroxydans sp.]